MEDDWDLQAVVRGCTGASSSSSSSSAICSFVHGGGSIKSEPAGPHHYSSCLSFPGELQAGQLFSLQVPDPFEARQSGNMGDLRELFRPFFPKPHPPQAAPVVSSLSSLCFSREQNQLKVPRQQHQPATMLSSHGGSVAPTASSQGPRPKRRKNQQKKVCHVPAEALASDVWAWRKYGQKPIKGSPYPRGYYRCSSSKGCLARKQVERNRSDPRMFIVTYTAEHNHPAPTHRNSLAGSTRQKALTTATSSAAGEYGDKPSPATKPTCSSSTATSLEDELPLLSANSESREEKDLMEDDEVEQEDFSGFPDTEVDDDFFDGLEEFAPGSPSSDGAAGDRFPDHFAGSFGLPWFPNSAATTAGGI